jgi:hypothetical protein
MLMKLNTLISRQKLFEEKFEKKLGEIKELINNNNNNSNNIGLDKAFIAVRLE